MHCPICGGRAEAIFPASSEIKTYRCLKQFGTDHDARHELLARIDDIAQQACPRERDRFLHATGFFLSEKRLGE